MKIKEQIQKYYPELEGKWLDKYLEKNKDVLLRNIVQVWKLTQDTGYSVLQIDWKAMLWAKKDERYTIELAEKTMMDKIYCILGQLYNTNKWGKKGSRSKQFGMTGLLVVASMNVSIDQSDTRDMDDVVVAFGIDMTLYGGDHEEFKIEES